MRPARRGDPAVPLSCGTIQFLFAAVLLLAQSTFADIGRVQLVSPANGANGVAPCATLTWNAASGATGYFYEVKVGSQVITNGGSGGDTQVSLTLNEGTTYSWHVQGRTSQDTGPFSETWTFTTKSPIPAPTLTSPANGASIASLNVTLQWSALSDATFFDFEVDNGSGIVTNGTIDASNTSLSLTLPENSYTWRIRGSTSCRDGAWSAYSAFVIPPIPAPVQDFPANNQTGIGLQPTLQWEGANGATGYDYQLYSGVGGSLIDANSGSISGLSAQVNPVLLENTVYSWRVRGRTSARNGTWSSLASFTTVPPLAAPVLTSPADGENGTGLNVSLNWQAVSGATGYDYQVLQSGNVIQSGTGSPPQPIVLVANGVYQWQVRGKTSLRTGVWSAPFTFATQPPIPTPTLVSPPDGSVHNSLVVTLVWNSVGPLATSYNFEVDDTNGVAVTNGAVTGAITSVTITNPTDGTYTWMVQGATSERQGSWSTPFSYTIPPIPAPVQDFPTNNSTGIGLQPTLQWESAAGATGYDYQLYSGVGVSLIESGPTNVLSNQVTHVLSENTVYSWRVRGHTTARNGIWSPFASFTTVPPLVAPLLTSPADGTFGTGLSVPLNWQTVTGATGYDYQLLQGGKVVKSGSGSPPQTVNLAANGTYQWQARGNTGLRTGPWSASFTFSTLNIGVPVLDSPMDGADEIPFDPTLKWEAVNNATSYDCQIYLAGAIVASTNTSSTQATVVVHQSATYQWRVRAHDGQLIGAWSDFPSFTTRPPLDVPVLVSPPNPSEGTGLTVTNQWNPVDGATGYNLQFLTNGVIALSTNGSPNVISNLLTLDVNLPANNIYQWEVQAKTSLRTGPWSAPFSFSTLPLTISNEPLSQTVSGGNVNLTVKAGGVPPLSYQWLRNDEPIPNATNSTYIITNAQPTNGGTYSVVVSDAISGIVSFGADIIITSAALPFADNFTNAGAISGVSGLGSGNNFHTSLEPGEPLDAGRFGSNSVWLEWTAPSNGLALFSTLGSSFGTLLAVYQGNSLTNLTPVAADADDGPYRSSSVAFVATAGQTYLITVQGVLQESGDIVLSWSMENPGTTPIITEQPASLAVELGSNAVFQISAASSLTLMYQWYFMDLSHPIPGATSPTLQIPSINVSNVGLYFAVISNSAAISVETAMAALFIGPPVATYIGDAGSIPSGGTATAFFSGGSTGVGFGSSGTGFIGLSSSPTNLTTYYYYDFQPQANGILLVSTEGSTVQTVLSQVQGISQLNLVTIKSVTNSPLDGHNVLQIPVVSNSVYLFAVNELGTNAGTIEVSYGLGLPPAGSTLTETNQQATGSQLMLSLSVPLGTNEAYQWFHNGAGITNATNATFTIAQLGPSDAGYYSVALSNGFGTSNCVVAFVTETPPLSLKLDTNTVNPTPGMWVNGFAAQPTVLLFSPDLLTWTPVYTNTNALNSISSYINAVGALPRGFYKLQAYP